MLNQGFETPSIEPPVNGRGNSLRYLGVTKKEMMKAFVMEGLIYFAALASLLASVGIYLDAVIGKLAKKNIFYFEFAFPYHTFFILLIIFFAISVSLPPILSHMQSSAHSIYSRNL